MKKSKQSLFKRILKKGIGALKDDSTFFRTLRSLAGDSGSVSNPYDKSIWVYASIRAIAQNISRVPFNVYKNKKTNDSSSDILKREEVKNGALIELFQNPNPFMTFRSLMEATSTYLENYGECFWLLDGRSDITKLPKEIWVMNPEKLEPALNKEKTKVIGWNIRNKKKNDNEEVDFQLHEILFFRYFNPYDPIRGLSPLKASQISIDQDYFSSEYNRNFFKEGAILSGLISIEEELSPESYDRLLKQLEDRHGGASKAHKIGLLEGGAKWQNMSASQTDLDFKNLKNLNKNEILSAFRINPVILGDYSTVKSYEGVRAAHKAFWVESLVPKIKYIEETINKSFISKLSGNFYGEFNLNVIEALRDDFNYKVQTAWLLHRMNFPINMINERLDLGMSKVSWGDTAFIGSKNISIKDLLDDKNKPDNSDNKEPDKNIDNNDNSNKNYKDLFNKYNRIQWLIEKKFQSKISRFLFEQRKAITETLFEISNDFKTMTSSNIVDKLFPVKEEKRLKDILKPIYTTSIKSGADMVAEELDNLDFIFREQDFEYVINSRLNVIPSVIVYTIKTHLSQTLNDGIDSGDSVDELVERIKKVYNFASSKAKSIAKIESICSLNDGRFYMMKKTGINKHKWLTNCENHKNLNNKIVNLDSEFNETGLKYPNSNCSDLNCTCLSVAVREN